MVGQAVEVYQTTNYLSLPSHGPVAQPTSAVLSQCPARRATTLKLSLHPAIIDMVSNTGSHIKRPKAVLVQQLLLINAVTAGRCRQHVVAALANGTTVRLSEGPSLYIAANSSGR